MTSSDDQSDETEIHFQEAHGARLFRKGTPRAILEVKGSHIPTEIHEARLRGYDEAKERSAVSKPEARVTRRAETFGRGAESSASPWVRLTPRSFWQWPRPRIACPCW
jgi:hypothetical protein